MKVDLLTLRISLWRAVISDRGTVRMTIDVPRSFDIRAGQYVNVWIPSISFWSFLQSHPFIIASWGTKEGITTLDLLIEPRKGFTQKLYAGAEYYSERSRKGTENTFQQRSSNAVDNRNSLGTLYESIEQEGRSTAVDCHLWILRSLQTYTPSELIYPLIQYTSQTRPPFKLA